MDVTGAFLNWLENSSAQLSEEKKEEMRLRDITCSLINEDFTFDGLTDDDLESLIINVPLILKNDQFYSSFCSNVEKPLAAMKSSKARRLL